MLVVMDRSTQEEHLSQPLQPNNKQLKKAVFFLTGYNGTFNVTNSNNRFYFKKTITDGDDFIQTTIPPGAYEIESLNNEIRRIIIDEEHFSESDYPFQIKSNFTTLCSIIEISPRGPIISFMFNYGFRNLLGFHETILYKKYNLSPNPVDNLIIDNIFIERDIAHGMIYKQKRSGIIHNWTMTGNPGYNYFESFTGGLTWYMMETKDVISSFSFNLKIGKTQLVSFNGQSISFRLSTKEIYFIPNKCLSH